MSKINLKSTGYDPEYSHFERRLETLSQVTRVWLKENGGDNQSPVELARAVVKASRWLFPNSRFSRSEETNRIENAVTVRLMEEIATQVAA